MKQFKTILVIAVLLCILMLTAILVVAQEPKTVASGNPYPNMPLIAPIGERIEKYINVNESAKGPSIDPKKGYRIQELGKGLYMITDNAYQSMFMVYETGVVVVDAPPAFAQYIPKAIAEVSRILRLHHDPD